MSIIDIETARKLREMGAADLLGALEAQDEQLSVSLAFGERIRLAVDDAYTAFTDTKITGLIRRAGLRYPDADLRSVGLGRGPRAGPLGDRRTGHLRVRDRPPQHRVAGLHWLG